MPKSAFPSRFRVGGYNIAARRMFLTLLAGPLSLAWASVEAASPNVPHIEPDGIKGALFICGGAGMTEDTTVEFVKMAGGEKARILVIPAASSYADEEDHSRFIQPWRDRNVAHCDTLHCRTKERANDPSFAEPIRQATAIWITGGLQSRIASQYLGTPVETEIYKLLARGGVVGGSSAGAAIQSRIMLMGVSPGKAECFTGFDLLPGSIIDQHFVRRNRKPRLLEAINQNPGILGVGIDEKTTLIVRGRQLKVMGDSTVTFCFPQADMRPAKELELKSGDVADLVALRRVAAQRMLPPFPPPVPTASVVQNGSLVIVGGGSTPRAALDRFMELAGGVDAPIVVLPTANPDPLPEKVRELTLFEGIGAKNVTVLRARKKEEVEDSKFLAALRAAKGIWFGGGRQWRFVDAYAGTKAQEAFHDVLRAGGVIGGSSAGASIQGEVLARGNPLGNQEILADGYERGLGFLPGAAIDQHFSQRNRFDDMKNLIAKHPQLLGIGIDESTALVVRGHVGEVIGKNNVQFFDQRQESEDDDNKDFDIVRPGQRYNLKERRLLADRSE